MAYLYTTNGAFASVRLKKARKGAPVGWVQASASGRISEPRVPHADVLAHAGIPHVSIHGLRRTFSLLGEAASAPAGAIDQVMGHKSSAIAEGYRPRSVDSLRPYLAQIEHLILDKAGIAFDPATAATSGLRLVSAPEGFQTRSQPEAGIRRGGEVLRTPPDP